jgi:uncharacterized protein
MNDNSLVTGPVEKQARVWGMLCHLTALLGLMGIPFGHILGPLMVWIFKRKEYPFVNEQGKEALNFQLSMTLYALGAALLIFFKIGMALILILATINLVLVIIAGLKANSGEIFRYPFAIRFIK